MKRFKHTVVALLSLSILLFLFSSAEAKTEKFINGINIISASKTAQWTANGKGDDAKNYDLLISYYSANYYQTAYVGFELPENFNPEFVQSAKLKLTSTKLDTAIKANIHSADYSAFQNNELYTGNANAPEFNQTLISNIMPAAIGETAECDVTEYLKSASGNAAFRIACASKKYTNWYIGSCNNGGVLPQLEIEYDNGEGAHSVPEKIDYENGSVVFDKTGSFDTDEEITLKVMPNEHYSLSKLTVDGKEVNATNNTYTFQMPARNITENYIKAEFVLTDYIKTRNIYEDNMLLQRDKPVYIDGVCKNINSAKACLYKNDAIVQEKNVTIANDEWNVTFDAVSDYTAVYKIVIDGDNGSVTMNNVLFGDVYLFSGQSNMWKEVSYYKNTDKDYTKENVEKHLSDRIRVMYTKGSSCYGETNPTYDAAHKDAWRDFSSYSNVSSLPAVVFSAAAKLYEETDIPIGVISNAYPGSYISCWFPNTGIDACNSNRNKSSNERNWYNGRIYPIRNLKLSGVFWYQGEADSATIYHNPQYNYYAEMMTKLIDEWRELFDDEKLPFYYVQLCRLGHTVDENNPDTTSMGEVYIRQAQTDAYTNSEDKTNLGIVGTLDIYGRYDYPNTQNDANCRNDIHPGQKRLVGERLANFALRDIYNKDVSTAGPIAKTAEIRVNKIIVTYDCSGKLKIMDSAQYADSVTDAKIKSGEINQNILNEFEISGADNVWHSATAEITSNNQVTVYSEKVINPTQVRYAYSDYPEAPNLTDGSNLPSYVFMKTAADGGDVKPTEPPKEDECVKITADYNADGSLKNIKTEIIKVSEITSVLNTKLRKVFYWNSLGGMKPVSKAIRFNLGNQPEEGYITVSADTAYSKEIGYGFIGLKDGHKLDRRIDGFMMTQGYDLMLKNGRREKVTSADDSYVSCYNDTSVGETGFLNPIRFAVKAESGQYYHIKIHLVRADKEKEALVTLFTEMRHTELLSEPIPPEGMDYECNVHIEDFYNSGDIFTDTMLNISAIGENVAISSIEIESIPAGKTLWAIGDSTVADQQASLPYFPLQQCMGMLPAINKYIGRDWALVNTALGGLDSTSSRSFFDYVKDKIKPGDIVWFEHGYNNNTVSQDPNESRYIRDLEYYYNIALEKGADFIVASPIDTCHKKNFNAIAVKWSPMLANYTQAAKNFVEGKIKDGANNIAYVDLNTQSIKFLDAVTNEMITKGYNYADECPRFYYQTSHEKTYDRIHPNDYGADNMAYAFYIQANEYRKTHDDCQAEIFDRLLANAKTDLTPVCVGEEVYKLGKAPNAAYPKSFFAPVYFEHPLMIKEVQFDENGFPVLVTAGQVVSKQQCVYAKAVVEIYTGQEELKKRYISENRYDMTETKDQTLVFLQSDIPYSKGDKVKVYCVDYDSEKLEITDTIVSNLYTETDIFSSIKYLYKEDFSLINTDRLLQNGWKSKDAQSSLKIEQEDIYGNYLSFGPGSSSRGGEKVFEREYSHGIDDKLVISIDAKFVKSDNEYNEIVFHDGSAEYISNNSNYVCTGGYILHIYQTKEGIVYINGKETEIPNAVWTNIKAVCDFSNHKAMISAVSADLNIEYFNDTVAMNDMKCRGVSRLHYKFGKAKTGKVTMDNIKIYLQSEETK